MTALPADTLPRPPGLPHGLAPQRPAEPTYRLASGLALADDPRGGILFSLRPLVAMRLNPTGAGLVSGLSETEGRSASELAGGMDLSPAAAAAFLDDLADKRMVVRRPAAPVRWHSVSVIIAAHGRPAATRACVRSLLALDYAGEVEIILVDDATDPPLAGALAGLPCRVFRLDRNVGQSAARNLAAAEAEGELLAFIDNDCLASAGWLRDLVPQFNHAGIAAVGGRVVAPPPAGAVAAFEAVRSPLDMGAVEGPVGPRQPVAYLPSCNLLVRRDALLASGGFSGDMRVGEDVDLIWRLGRAGSRAHYAAAGEVVHDHRVKLGALLARRADYGSSEAELHARHPANGRVMHLPRAGLVALAGLVFAAAGWLAVAAAGIFLAAALLVREMAGKRHRLRGMGIGVPVGRLARSILREHGAGLYHLGHDVTRYYGLPLLAVGLLWPPLLAAAAVLLLVPPVCDHRRLRPSLSLPTYAGLFWLEAAVYQFGVWRGCRARRLWRPLLPTIRWRR